MPYMPSQVGMETNMVNRMERMDLQKQIDVFYTAYSKVRVSNVLVTRAEQRPVSGD